MSTRSLVTTTAILAAFLGGYVVSNRRAPVEGQEEGVASRSSSRPSQRLMWVQTAPVWSTIFRSPTASFRSVNQASLRQAKDAAPKRRSRGGGLVALSSNERLRCRCASSERTRGAVASVARRNAQSPPPHRLQNPRGPCRRSVQSRSAARCRATAGVSGARSGRICRGRSASD